MKKFLLLCLFSLQYQLTQTGAWKKFGPEIQLANSAIDRLEINTYMSTPGEVYIAANQTGAESNFRVQLEYFAPLASRVVPISDNQLAVNRLRNPLVVLMVGRLSVIANSFDYAPGTISVEERNDTNQVVSKTLIETGFPTDVTSLAFDENCNFLCAGSCDGKLQLWGKIMGEAHAQRSSSDLFKKLQPNSKEKEEKSDEQ
ncbi:MAG: hypothetical protein LVQ75_00200 [Candidatus Babeliales bacterium]|jgi:hypothetical protein